MYRQLSDWINELGVARASPRFFDQLFSFVFRKHFPKSIIRLFDVKCQRFVESGIAIHYEISVKGSIFGFLKNMTPSYRKCIKSNSISTLENNSYGSIKLENLTKFLSFLGILYLILWTIFVMNHFSNFLVFKTSLISILIIDVLKKKGS